MRKKQFVSYSKVIVSGRLRFCLDLIGRYDLSSKKIVDIGCSNGLIAFQLRNKNIKKYLGVDLSESAIDYAKKHATFGEYFVSFADKLPIPDAFGADLVFMFDIIEHVPKGSEARVLREACRVLKKGGKLLFTTPNNVFWANFLDPAWYFGHRHYKKDEIVKLFESNDLHVVESGVVGSVWSYFYLIWHYVSKWIFKNKLSNNQLLMDKDEEGFKKKGIHTLYIIAEKI